MAQIEEMTPGEVLADAKVAQFIKELGIGIAEAQTELDENSVRQMEAFTRPRDGLGGRSLLQLGLMPPFYHYEHADLSVSLQLRLQVAETDEFGFGLDARFDSDRRSSEESEASERVEESGSRVEARSAHLRYRADSGGVLAVNGSEVSGEGSDPLARLRDLQGRLTDRDAIDVVLYDPPETDFDISTTAPPDRVITTSRSVAIQETLKYRGLIVLRENEDTTYVLNPDTSVDTEAQGDLTAYAEHVQDAIEAEDGFDTLLHPPDPEEGWNWRIEFGHDVAHVENAADRENLIVLARILAATGDTVRVEGMTDRTGSAAYNVDLSRRRAAAVKKILRDNGVPESQFDEEVKHRGEHRAEHEGELEENEAAPEWRAAWITTPDRTAYWLGVSGILDPQTVLTGVEPDLRAEPGSGNGFVFLWTPVGNLEIGGETVTIASESGSESEEFTFRGSPGGGHGSGTPEAYARNLAADINESEPFRASREGNVVHVMAAGDEYAVQLYSWSREHISLEGREGIRVTEEFSRVRTSRVESQEGRRTTIGVGATLDMRETRQFGLTVTGNSSISARLVSVPAPDEFKAAIRAMQEERER